MSSNCYYYNSEEAGEGLGVILIVILVLIPVIPAGDIGLYFAKIVSDQKPIVLVNILAWVVSIGIYGAFLLFLFFLLDRIPLFIRILLLYAQGIYFAFVVSETEMAKWSPYVVNVSKAIYRFLMSPA